MVRVIHTSLSAPENSRMAELACLSNGPACRCSASSHTVLLRALKRNTVEAACSTHCGSAWAVGATPAPGGVEQFACTARVHEAQRAKRTARCAGGAAGR